jgi:peptide deformylase
VKPLAINAAWCRVTLEEEQMIKKILQRGAAVLERKAGTVTLPEERELVHSIVSDLIDTAADELSRHAFTKGIGLSAPQINYEKRIFVVKLPDQDFRAFINPVITHYSEDTDLQYEGCLSFFDYRGRAVRSLEIEVEYFDLQFKHQQETFKHGSARLIQHEYDHLDGILYIERMPPGEYLLPYSEYVKLKETDWKY